METGGLSQFADGGIRRMTRGVTDMIDFLKSNELWGGVGNGVAWVVTVCLLLAGIVGCILPILPGHLIL